MMADDDVVLVLAKAIAVREIQEGLTGIAFLMHDDSTIGISIPDEEFSRLVGLALDQAMKIGATRQSLSSRVEEIRAHPVAVTSLGVASGRAPGEAILAVRLGNLSMTFSVSPTMIRSMCADFERIQPGGPAAKFS